MSNDGTNHNSGNDTPETDSTLPLSRRGALAATGLAGLGLAGATPGTAQEEQYAVEEHDHSGAYNTASQLGEESPVESITVDALTSAQHNDVVHASEFDTLNDAVASADPDSLVHVVLPAGVTEFDKPIENFDRDLIIEGQGKDASTLRSVNSEALYAQYDDAGELTLALQGFTLDLNHVPSDRVVFAEEEVDFGQLLVDDIRVVNVNNENQTTDAGFFNFDGANELVVIDDSEFRFDTFVNRSGHKYRIYTEGGIPGVTKRFYARRNHHVGERINIAEARPEEDLYNGYRVNPTEFALVEGCDFRKWDQYGTFIQGRDGATIKILNNHFAETGHGDILRAGASGLADEIGVRLLVHGNTIRGPAKASGDRGIMIQHGNDAALQSAVITNNTIQGVLVPIAVTYGRNIVIANNSIIDSGQPDYGGSSRPGIIVRNRRGPTTDVRIAGNLITNRTDDRVQGPAVWVRDEGKGWSGFLAVENNFVYGIETDQEEYGTTDSFVIEPSGVVTVVERHNVIAEVEEPAVVTFLAPTENDPVTVGPGEEFDIVWETDQAGEHNFSYYDGDSWVPLDGPNRGDVGPGEHTITLVAPDTEGTYSLRNRFTNLAGDVTREFASDALIVEGQ